MKKIIILSFSILFLLYNNLFSQELRLNDLEYFETNGVNYFIYNNLFTGGFNDEKNAGIEIIHHGTRTIQGGAIRLSNTPEQWDLVPKITNRVVDIENGRIEAKLRYDEFDFESVIVVESKGKGIEITIHLDEVLPKELKNKAGFNLEFLPSQYWGKTYLMNDRINIFPHYAVGNTITKPNDQKIRQYKGYSTSDDRGTARFIDPLPLEKGNELVIAPEDPRRMVTIKSVDNDLMLFDGRILAQNGWFVVRSLLPSESKGKVLSWYIEANSIEDWIREPNIGFSQIGYLPTQKKVSVIELDENDQPLDTAYVYKIEKDGSTSVSYSGKTELWGNYYKYNYIKFDFSTVDSPGIYYLKYGNKKTNHFVIQDNVYDKITDATTDIWIPIHMNHMVVNEAYRVWHGEPFKEGYKQAPPNTDHFDLHSQGPNTNTKFESLETIPGLNIGGFFDAGDFDIETKSNINVIQNLTRTWEYFKPMRDQTFIDHEQRYVDIHRPDGIPDLIQYIEHGTMNLVAQAEIIGHMSQTLSNSILDNYHHLGDAASITDGLEYNPELAPYEVNLSDRTSGKNDDMWAFTDRDPKRDLYAANTLAAASRVLESHNSELATRALNESIRLRNESLKIMSFSSNNKTAISSSVENITTNLQLYITTEQQEYLDNYLSLLWTFLDKNLESGILIAIEAIPYMNENYKENLSPYIKDFKNYIIDLESKNPYGVPITLGNWAGSGSIMTFGTAIIFANKYFPDIISQAHIFKASDWLFGNHPYHNYSLVSTQVAVRPKEVFYGNNRADFSAIPGNVAPGILFRKPDHFENYDDWPFLWGQNEGTINGNTRYLIFGSALKNAVSR